jgi:hypothetical protein
VALESDFWEILSAVSGVDLDEAFQIGRFGMWKRGFASVSLPTHPVCLSCCYYEKKNLSADDLQSVCAVHYFLAGVR